MMLRLPTTSFSLRINGSGYCASIFRQATQCPSKHIAGRTFSTSSVGVISSAGTEPAQSFSIHARPVRHPELGTAVWSAALAPHSVENVGSIEILILSVELKHTDEM